jgi:hypothetical protein
VLCSATMCECQSVCDNTVSMVFGRSGYYDVDNSVGGEGNSSICGDDSESFVSEVR